jgi:hypothetical protein
MGGGGGGSGDGSPIKRVPFLKNRENRMQPPSSNAMKNHS